MAELNSPTIDPEQTELFNSFSKYWWDPNGPLRGLHVSKDIIAPYMKESIIKAGLAKKEFINTSTPLKGVRILDAGCGGGILTESLAELGCTIVAIDVNSELLKVAKDHAALSTAKLNNLTYALTPVEDHAKENSQKYDVVISNYVLEHINEIELYLKSCVECLRSNGLIFVSSIGKTIMGWLVCIVLTEKIFKLIPDGAHDYNRCIKIGDVEKMLLKCKYYLHRVLHLPPYLPFPKLKPPNYMVHSAVCSCDCQWRTQHKTEISLYNLVTVNCKTEESRGLLYNTDDFKHFFIDDTSGFYILKSIKE